MKLASFLAKPVFMALYLWVIAGVAAYFLIDKLVMPVVAGQFKGTVEVPELFNTSPEDAGPLLLGKGLTLLLDSAGDYSADVPAGRILSQFPASNTTVKQGRRVWVKISKGLRNVSVPQLKGYSLRQAEISLQQLGLVVDQVIPIGDASVPEGAVLGTRPLPGTELEVGSRVDVQVSAGRRSVANQVPDLVGMSLAQARERIQAAGLRMGAVSERPHPGNLPRTVLEQSPRAGRAVTGAVVDLVISK